MPVRAALVGYTNSSLDENILRLFNTFMPKNGIVEYDPIDLNNGRDFLAEDRKYDAVCLFMIFRYRPEELKPHERLHAQLFDPASFRTSPNHRREKWRDRLLSADPKIIHVVGFNELAEIGSDYLGDLPGYRTVRLSDSDVVYVKS